MRSEQHIGPEASQKVVFAFDSRVQQHAGPRRLYDDFLREREAAFGIVPIDAISLRRYQPLNLVFEIQLLFEKQSVPIGEQKLQVTQLGAIDGRIIDLREDAAPDRKPDTASGRIRCAHSILVGVRPTRFVAWSSECASISPKVCHRISLV
jgi:hypothetical protein